MGLGREVELHLAPARQVVDHRFHGTGLRVDGHDRRGRIGRGVQDRADRVEREPLQAHVERRLDRETAELHPPVAEAAPELLRRPAEEVRLVQLRIEVTGPELELPPRRRPQLGLADVVVLPHRVQHLVPAGQRGVRVPERVVHRRRLRQAGEQRRLHERQLRGRLGEVRPGRRLRAVRVPAVEDLVEVVGEDLLARVLLEELRGEAGLLDLARQRPLRVADVEVAHELLCDRRPALHDVALREVLVERRGGCPGSRERRAARSARPRSPPWPRAATARSSRAAAAAGSSPTARPRAAACCRCRGTSSGRARAGGGRRGCTARAGSAGP